MHGSKNFRQGGSRLSRQEKKTFDNVFIHFLFDFSPRYTEFFKENYKS